MREPANIHYPDADRIRVVLDNLSTHTVRALYETFPASEAHRILQRLKFRDTPKHASWLHMVEIEIGASANAKCLSPRSKHGNVSTMSRARAYPDISKES